MMCSICHSSSKYLPRYECGHHFHASCLEKWCESSKSYNNRLPAPKEKETVNKINFQTKLRCPYCTKIISLYRTTKNDTNYLKFHNDLSYLINKVHDTNYSIYREGISGGRAFCERCFCMDDVRHMKITENNFIEWLCKSCCSRLFTSHTPEYEYFNDIKKNRDELTIDILNLVWENRRILRKTMSLKKNIIDKCQEFVDTVNNTGKYPKRKYTIYNSEIKKLSNRILLLL